jgi:hypothetical protein
LELLVRTRTVRTARAQHALYYPVAPIAEGTPVASTDARCLFHEHLRKRLLNSVGATA